MKDEVVLLTVKDLAKRWQKDENSIRRYVNDGVLTTCKGVPGVMFHPKHIAELEGVEIDKFSPLERRRLLQENKALKEIVNSLMGQLNKIAMLGAESMQLLQKCSTTNDEEIKKFRIWEE